MFAWTKKVWHAFFPREIHVPKCVRELLEFVYPGVDWDRATFHQGWPHLLGVADHAAITLPHSWKPGHTRTYFKDGKWDPCSCDGLGLIVHEGFHVMQFQNIWNGWMGIGLLNGSTILYLACWADHGFSYDDHPAEKAAYKVAGHGDSMFDECCLKTGSLPCDCGCNPPSVDAAGLQDFQTNCSNVVQQSNGIGFWTQLANCTPFGFIKEWAKKAYELGCENDASWGVRWVPCGVGLILAGVLWAIWGIWYGIWFLIALIASLVVAIFDWVVNIVGGIVSGVVGLVEGAWDVITSPFSEVEGNLWYTTFDATGWQVPDVEITKDGRSRTKASPSIAEYQGQLYAAYKSRDNEDLWYTIFDGNSWLDEDIRITSDGKTRTSTSPSLAAYDGNLYLAYRASDGDDLWFNVFDGNDWLDDDIKITKDGNTRTSHSPSLAAYGGSLYMAYKSSSDFDIWFNVFDGSDWLDEDVKISKDGKTRTSDAPALCEFDGNLYLAYKASTSDDLWFNVFDGSDWLDDDIQITKDGRSRTSTGPNLAVFDNLLYLVYKSSDGEDVWYNVFDGTSWRDEDCKVTQEDGTIRTGTRPSAAAFNGLLYLVYRGAG